MYCCLISPKTQFYSNLTLIAKKKMYAFVILCHKKYILIKK